MNFKKKKVDFPIFGKKEAPKEFVYLDSAATSQKPQQVIDALVDFYRNYNANIYRGVHDLSERATELYEEARCKVSKFINAKDASEIIFTQGATAGINFIADAWARQWLKPGDEIVVTEAEHHSNFLPWQRLCQRLGLTLRFIPINPEHFVIGCAKKDHFSLSDELYAVGMTEDFSGKCQNPACDFLEGIITPKTKLIALSISSNVLGPIWDEKGEELKKIIERAHKHGSKVLIDATQTVPHKPFDVQDLNADFVVFSGHKMLAPTGIGVLFIKKELHDEVEPYQVGGSMVYFADFESSKWQKAPLKFEAGTPPIAQAIGLGVAIDYLTNNVDFKELRKYEAKLCSELIEGLEQISGIEIIGNKKRIKEYGHLVSFTVDGVHPHDLASYLDMRSIAIRAGHHCAQPLAKILGIEATARISFYFYNTSEDVQIVLKEIEGAISSLRKGK